MELLIPDLESDLFEAASRRARPERRRRRWLGLAAIGVVLVAGGATAAVVTQHHDSADPRIKAEIGILRRPVTKADAVPGHGGRSGGVQTQEARQAKVDLPGWKAWVAPTTRDGGACLLILPPYAAGPGSGSCFRLVDILRATQGKAAHPETGTVKGGGVYVAGIVPDGVDHVTVKRANGTRLDVKVHDNVYLGYSHHSTVEVSYGNVKSEARSPGAPPVIPTQTAAGRRAARKARASPSKRRPIRILPRVKRGTARTEQFIDWRARLNGGAYTVRIRGPRCAPTARWLAPQKIKRSLRGRIIGVIIEPPGRYMTRPAFIDRPTDHAWCRGRYKVDVAWVDHGRRYPPFGTGTFIVR